MSTQILLRVRPSLPDTEDAHGKHGPILIESAIAAIHSLRGTDGLISLEIGFFQGKVCFFVRCSESAAPLLESQLYGQYPDADIEQMDAAELEPAEGESMQTAELMLSRPEIFPIKRHPQFDDLLARQNVDPLAGITSALLRYADPRMRGHVQIVFRPLSSRFRKKSLKFLPLLTKGFSKRFSWYAKLFSYVHLVRGWRWWAWAPVNILMGGYRAWFSFLPPMQMSMEATQETQDDRSEEFTKSGRRSHEDEDPVSAATDKVNRLLFLSSVRLHVIAPSGSSNLSASKLGEMVGSFKQFTQVNSNSFVSYGFTRSSALTPVLPHTAYALSVEEIATLWHMPNALVKTPNIDWVLSKKLEPPVNLPVSELHPEMTVLGEAVFRGHRRRFGIKPDDRRRHMYVIGKTGMGKSTLLENMIHADIHAGHGVGVIDPHGDLIESILRFIPSSRTNDVVLFDPADRDYPLSFNMLASTDQNQHPLIVSGLMSVFTKLWPDVWSGRMEHILRNTLLALIEGSGNSMLGILRMFSDDAFRHKVVSHTSDQLVKSFWQDEYASWSDKYRTEAVAAIQNKIGQLLSVPMIRNIVGQTGSTLSIRDAMDTKKIVLVNLSKGAIGEDNSAFLGSMLVTKFQLDAMSRTDIPESERQDFYLYVDEFQNFATESFATILSEARKYRLGLTLAHQYIGQLKFGDNNDALRDAVFGNVGSMVSFQIGSDDAEDMALQFEEMVEPKDILSLPKYHAYMRLMIDGMPSKPFSVTTLPPPTSDRDARRVELIRRASRERYCEKRAVVEDKIGRWLQSAQEGRKTATVSAKAKEKEEEEMKKAKKKKMSLEQYRAWRDREMWTNDFNALRKKALTEALSADETAKMAELEKKLEQSGGVPLPSKAMEEVKGKGG
ncbi:MAG: type IV secretion system DNA-binding domain-containing protein [Candidatus Peribacteraceae bacterium]